MASTLPEQIKSIADFIEDRKPSAVRKRLYFYLAGLMTGIVLTTSSVIYYQMSKPEPAKATHLIYHCKKKGRPWEKVPLVVDGVIKTETQLFNLYSDLLIATKCESVIIEPTWQVILSDEASPLRKGQGGKK